MARNSFDQPLDDSAGNGKLALNSPTLRSFDPLWLMLILIVAGALRFHGIARHCFWVDESASVQLASGHPLGVFDFPTDRLLPGGLWMTDPFGSRVTDVFRAIRGDTHPPLYLMALHFWRQWFGPGDASTRSLSAVCGLIAIVFLADAVRRLHGRTAAWWSAIMMAVSSPQIEFSQEARSYMMLVMWTAIILWATARLLVCEPTWGRRVTLIAALLGGLLTHYYAVSTLAAISVYALLQPRRARNPILWSCAITAVIFAVTLGPLIWVQRRNFHANMTWIADDDAGLFLRTLGRISILPLHWFFTPMFASMGAAAVSSVLFLIPWLRLRAVPHLLLWTLVMISAIGIVASADLTNHSQTLNLLRYTLPSSVPTYALVSALLIDQRGWLRHLLPATLLLGSLIGLPESYVQAHKQNWDTLGNELAIIAAPSQPLVFYQETAADWHGPVLQIGVTRYGHLWDRPLLAITRPIDSATRDELIARKTFWVITGTEHPPIDRFISSIVPTGRVVPAPYVGDAIEFRIEPSSAATTEAIR